MQSLSPDSRHWIQEKKVAPKLRVGLLSSQGLCQPRAEGNVTGTLTILEYHLHEACNTAVAAGSTELLSRGGRTGHAAYVFTKQLHGYHIRNTCSVEVYILDQATEVRRCRRQLTLALGGATGSPGTDHGRFRHLLDCLRGPVKNVFFNFLQQPRRLY